MWGKRLSESMNGVGDDLIADAMEYKTERKRSVWLRVAAVAAVLALLMTWLLWPGETEMPGDVQKNVISERGVLRVYACEMRSNDETQMEEYELADGVISYTPYWSPHTNALGHGIPLQFWIPEGYYGDREISINLSTECGRFFGYNDKMNSKSCVSISENTIIFWDGNSPDGEREKLEDGTVFYMDVVIRADGEIVGYGVIKAECSKQEGYPPVYALKKCTTVCFPLVEGQVQQVSEEYVRKQILKCKQ